MMDLRDAVRAVRRRPRFAVTAIVTLALGIGLSTATFTVANTLLLRPLPIHDQNRLVLLWGETPDGHFADLPLTYPQAREFARQTRTLSSAAFVEYDGAWPVSILENDRLFTIRRGVVSGNFFDVLGTRPLLGRGLGPSDDVVGAAPVMVLSYGAWQRSFGGDPRVVGRRVVMQLDGVTYTIVGVMPQGLEYPSGADCWTPVVPWGARTGTDSVTADVNVIGRLAAGATLAEARAELTTYFDHSDVAKLVNVRGVAHTFPDVVLGDTRPALLVFLAASALLLLITCINVGNLLLVRGVARAREMAVRAALGAERGRIIGQLVAENAILAVGGGIIGTALSLALVKLFVVTAPADVPRVDEIHANLAALAVAVALTAIAMFLSGLVPAVITSRADLLRVIGSGARESGRRRTRLATQGLVAGQIALAMMILAVAGLLTSSFVRLDHAKLELEPSHLLIAEPSIRYDIYNDLQKQLALLDQMVAAVRSLPGVRGVSPVVAVPFSGTGGWDGQFTAQGQSREEARGNPMFNIEIVTPDYFTTLGVPILRGRGFADTDGPGAPQAIVLSQSAAHALWPGENALGKHIAGTRDQSGTVVGIVPDTRYRDLRDARPSIYFALRQSRFPFAPATLAIRTSGSPTSIVPELRQRLASVAPGIGLQSAESFEALEASPLALPRLDALLLGLFAGAALLLAGVGLYAVVAAAVAQRTRELGIRLALGATPFTLRALVLREAAVVASVGVAVGLGGALVLSRSVQGLLYDVAPADPAILGIVAVVLVFSALVAALGPARRAARTDPVIALRAD